MDRNHELFKGRNEMGKIIVSENTSLDGVVQDPTGEEGFKHGGWFVQVSDNDRVEWAKVALDEALHAEAWLLGRRSYEFFAARWPSRTGPLAERLNNLPKYVVSSTLEKPKWNNTTVLKGDATGEISQLKQKLNGDIVIPASIRLVQTLMEHELVDEIRLMVYPFVLGPGIRLFGETGKKKRLHLVHSKAVGDNLALLSYGFVSGADGDN